MRPYPAKYRSLLFVKFIIFVLFQIVQFGDCLYQRPIADRNADPAAVRSRDIFVQHLSLNRAA